MSVIGPRPGLWNQDILTAERDKYNANDVKPGLTGCLEEIAYLNGWISKDDGRRNEYDNNDYLRRIRSQKRKR